jgi:hypothetical protein
MNGSRTVESVSALPAPGVTVPVHRASDISKFKLPVGSNLNYSSWLLLVLPPFIGNYWLLLQVLAIIAIIGYY